jgi:hypothetical protein
MVVYRPVIGVRNSLLFISPSSYLRAKNDGAAWLQSFCKPHPHNSHRTIRPNWLLEAALHPQPKQA